MLERMTYLEEKDGICICRCYGSGTYIDMPSYVHGKPVIALKDHCFAPEASIRIDRSKLKSILRSEWQQEETGRMALPESEEEAVRNALQGSAEENDTSGPSAGTEEFGNKPEDSPIGAVLEIENPMCALSLRERDLPQTLKRTEG